jgi:hypothetical protein
VVKRKKKKNRDECLCVLNFAGFWHEWSSMAVVVTQKVKGARAARALSFKRKAKLEHYISQNEGYIAIAVRVPWHIL